MMPQKLVYVTLDGLSDSSYSSLNGQTPLEYADTPNMDSLAEEGRTGWMYTVKEGIAPESDQAMFSLLGYDPFENYTGRGVLETMGYGLDVENGNLYIRCNFASLDDEEIDDFEARIDGKEAEELSQKINQEVEIENVEFKLVATIGYRAVLIIKSDRELSGRISNSNPSYEIVENFVSTAVPRPKSSTFMPKAVESLERGGEFTASVINEFLRKSRKVLEDTNSEAECILTRGASTSVPDLDPLKGRWKLLADMPVEKAIGKLMGMEMVERPDTYKEEAEEILHCLEDSDAVYAQIKGPDSRGHRGDVEGKVESIEKVDRQFIGNLIENTDEDTLVCITADHSTECRKRAHSEMPVPVILTDGKDRVKEFSETEVKKGSIGKLSSGIELFDILTDNVTVLGD